MVIKEMMRIKFNHLMRSLDYKRRASKIIKVKFSSIGFSFVWNFLINRYAALREKDNRSILLQI